MDQRTPGLIPHPADSDHLRDDIAVIRDNLGGLIGELDRRRHEAFNIRLQLRRHPIPLALAALALVGLIGGAIAASVIRRRRRDRLVPRLSRIRRALGRLVRDPDHIAAVEPAPRHLGLNILGSAAKAAAAIAAKQMVGRRRAPAAPARLRAR